MDTANIRSWTDAADLRQGDQLVGVDGSLQTVSALLDADQTTTVYNLTVDDIRTYYTGDAPVLPHNAQCGNDPGTFNYGSLDQLGRPTGVGARLQLSRVGTGSSASRQIDPPGFVKATRISTREGTC